MFENHINLLEKKFKQIFVEPDMQLNISEDWNKFDDYIDAVSSKYKKRYRKIIDKCASINKKELSRKPISAGEVKEILKKLDEDSTDQIQRRTLEYVNKFTTANPKKVNKTVTSLMKVEELTQEQCYELIDINPQTVQELRVFTSGWKKLLPNEKLEEILSIVAASRD